MENTKMTYEKLAERTETILYGPAGQKLAATKTTRLLHAAMGFSTEAGEFMDAIKRFAYYDSPLDEENLAEELGDILWYAALAANALGTSFEKIQRANISKLRARYPKGFKDIDAQERNLSAERDALKK